MERFLGEELGDVRVHSEPPAARTAAALKADAFTVAQDIFFGSGRAKLDTPSGMALLGHELTHVRQQRGLGRSAPASHLAAQSEEMEAGGNELALRGVLAGGDSLAPGPVSLTLGPSGLPTSEGTMRGAAVRVSPPQSLPAMLSGGPSMMVARAPADREASTQAPAPEGSPAAEPSATQQRAEGGSELDVNAVARQVYDWIMRRLAVERERAGYP